MVERTPFEGLRSQGPSWRSFLWAALELRNCKRHRLDSEGFR